MVLKYAEKLQNTSLCYSLQILKGLFFKDLHKCNSVQADKIIFVIEMIAFEHMTLSNK